jgi:imidazolonepropionase-like amidohydrolase
MNGVISRCWTNNEEALISTTRLPSEWLEINNKVGTVEPGKYADLILLVPIL